MSVPTECADCGGEVWHTGKRCFNCTAKRAPEMFEEPRGPLPVPVECAGCRRDVWNLLPGNLCMYCKPANKPAKPDNVQRPKHYVSHPSGVECITITEHLNFCLGNAIKYIWRAGLKGKELEDLKKAVWYIQREIARREKEVEKK